MERTEDAGLPQPQEGGRPGAARRPASPLDDPSLAPLLAKSPTLQAGLAQARREGIVVQWGTAGEGTYLVPGVKIVIDENAIGQGTRLARSLSHEVGHHLFTEPSNRASKQAYVDSELRGEAAATLSNVQVQREIVAGGGPRRLRPASARPPTTRSRCNELLSQWPNSATLTALSTCRSERVWNAWTPRAGSSGMSRASACPRVCWCSRRSKGFQELTTLY